MKRKIMVKRTHTMIITQRRNNPFLIAAAQVIHGMVIRIESKDGDRYYISPCGKYCEVGKLFDYPCARFENKISTLPQDIYQLWRYGLR